ncbi:MAG: HepT-like ribonuclease domain-containing protein [Bacteroidota bacterium]
MQREINKYLFDVQTALDNIEAYVGHPKLFEIFKQNLMLQQAIERNLEIIGEAVNSLLKIDPEIKITSARRMVDTRNKIIHGYDEIQPEQIWNIVINHLPILKQEVESLLK